MNVSPLYDRVLIERQEEPTKSESGLLFLPDSAIEKPARGVVLAVGAGKVSDTGTLTPLQVEVGQTVAFGKYAGTEIKFDGVERLIMREDDILGIIE